MTGSRCGWRPVGMTSSRFHPRWRVTLYRKRRAATATPTELAESCRSRLRCSWNARISAGPSISGELRDILQVGTLRGQPEVAKPHVLGHALAKRGHRWLLCRMGRATGAAPRSSKRIHRTKEVQRAELQARSAPMISGCKRQLPRSGLVQACLQEARLQEEGLRPR